MSTEIDKLGEQKRDVAIFTDEQISGFRDMLAQALPPKIKLIPGGNENIEVAGDTRKKVVAVILKFHNANVFMEEPEKGAKKVPVCWSANGIKPVKDCPKLQSEQCVMCEKNQYGSAEIGRGKACKNMIRTYILVEGGKMPAIFSIPPTSQKNFRNFLGVLAFNGETHFEVAVEITSSKDNIGSFDVSVAKFKKIGKLSQKTIDIMLEYRDKILPLYNVPTGEELKDEYKEVEEDEPQSEGDGDGDEDPGL